jgi:hypothetical protein
MILGRLDRAPAGTAWLAICAAGLVLAGCDRAASGTDGNTARSASTDKQPTTVPSPTPTPMLTPKAAAATPIQRAFRAVFNTDSPFIDTNSEHGFDATITAEKLLWIDDRAVLVTSTYFPGGTHGTIGYLDVYYLAAAGDGFSVKGKWPEAVSGNGHGGEPNPWSITDRFGAIKSIYSEAGWSGQGYSCSSFKVTELAPGAPRSVAVVPIYYDDLGTENGVTKIEGRITKIVPDRSFTVRYTGRRTFSETWTRKGNKYVLKGETRMETC